MRRIIFGSALLLSCAGALASGLPRVDAAQLVMRQLEEAAKQAIHAEMVSYINKHSGIINQLAELEQLNLTQVVAEHTRKTLDNALQLADLRHQIDIAPIPEASSLLNKTVAAIAAYDSTYIQNRPDRQVSIELWKDINLDGNGGGNSEVVRNALQSTLTESVAPFWIDYETGELTRETGVGVQDIMRPSLNEKLIDNTDNAKLALLGNSVALHSAFDPRSRVADYLDNGADRKVTAMAAASIAEAGVDTVLEDRRKLTGRKLTRGEFADLLGLPVNSPAIIASFESFMGEDGRVVESLELVTSAGMQWQFNQFSNGDFVDESDSGVLHREIALETAAAYRDVQKLRLSAQDLLAKAIEVISIEERKKVDDPGSR